MKNNTNRAELLRLELVLLKYRAIKLSKVKPYLKQVPEPDTEQFEFSILLE